MKTFFLLFIIVFGLFACRPNEDENYHILIPGKGFDNIELGTTTLDDIIKYYGNNFSVDTFYVRPFIAPSSLSTDSLIKNDIYSIKFSYDTLGVAFFFKPTEKNIFGILVQAPFKGKTDKGILLNESTFKDVETKYGETSWSFAGDYILKSYEGISFKHEAVDAMTYSKTEYAKYIDDKVTQISIDKLRSKN